MLEWQQAYHPLNVSGELAKMKQWLDANPRRRKKNYRRFVINWLGKAHAQVLYADVQRRYSSAPRQQVLTDQHGNRYTITAEGSRKYIFSD